MEVTKLVDSTGWPIVIGGRVRTQITLTSGKAVYKHGEVVKVYDDGKYGWLVEIRLFKNMNIIIARPEDCKVMKGKTRNSFQYELIKEKFKRKR